MATRGVAVLRSPRGWQRAALPTGLVEARQAIGRDTHVVLFLPLWRGEMPALVYRCYFRAHRMKSLERNILGCCGIAPIGETLIGRVSGLDEAARLRWFVKLHALGVKAA